MAFIRLGVVIDFFISTLKISPSDGKILHFGVVEGRKIEQIKGKTYSLDALIGGKSEASTTDVLISSQSANVVQEENFAKINDIPYSLDTLLGQDPAMGVKTESAVGHNAIVPTKDGATVIDVRKADSESRVHGYRNPAERHGLFFCVIYLAPGDYHRFHSPTYWVVETRRHFAGECWKFNSGLLSKKCIAEQILIPIQIKRRAFLCFSIYGEITRESVCAE